MPPINRHCPLKIQRKYSGADARSNQVKVAIPLGRPKGSRNKTTLLAEALLDDQTELIISKVIEKALQGNSVALRICVDRLLPKRDRPVQFELPADRNARRWGKCLQDRGRGLRPWRSFAPRGQQGHGFGFFAHGQPAATGCGSTAARDGTQERRPVKITKQQLRRLATLEAKLDARSVRGLLPLKSATEISDAYHALEELNSMRRRGIELSEADAQRHDRLETYSPRWCKESFCPSGISIVIRISARRNNVSINSLNGQ